MEEGVAGGQGGAGKGIADVRAGRGAAAPQKQPVPPSPAPPQGNLAAAAGWQRWRSGRSLLLVQASPHLLAPDRMCRAAR